jgi:hypothetical protein
MTQLRIAIGNVHRNPCEAGLMTVAGCGGRFFSWHRPVEVYLWWFKADPLSLALIQVICRHKACSKMPGISEFPRGKKA